MKIQILAAVSYPEHTDMVRLEVFEKVLTAFAPVDLCDTQNSSLPKLKLHYPVTSSTGTNFFQKLTCTGILVEQGICLIAVHPKVATNIHYFFYHSIKIQLIISQCFCWSAIRQILILEGSEPPGTMLSQGHTFVITPFS